MSSGSLQATSTPYLPPVPHTVSVPQGMLWMRGSWNNMEALTAVSLLWWASHQRQTSRWKNLGGFYDIRLWRGSDMMPHRGTGGETWVSVYVLCQTRLPKCSWSSLLSALSLMMHIYDLLTSSLCFTVRSSHSPTAGLLCGSHKEGSDVKRQ